MDGQRRKERRKGGKREKVGRKTETERKDKNKDVGAAFLLYKLESLIGFMTPLNRISVPIIQMCTGVRNKVTIIP